MRNPLPIQDNTLPLMGEGKPCTTLGAGQSPEPQMVQGVGVKKSLGA